jgi:hypothetical protein
VPELVVMPVAIETVQAVPAAIGAVFAVRVILAVAPVPDAAASKVVEPHPDAEGVASVPSVQSGTAKVMVSSATSPAVRVKSSETAEMDDVTGVTNIRLLWVTAGATIAGELAIGVVETSGEFARVTAAVRVFRFPVWGDVLVVTPLAIVTSQVVNAFRIAVLAVRVMVVVAPDPDLPVSNVVLPQPLKDGVASVPSVKCGRTSVITSLTSNRALISNLNLKDVVAAVTVVPKVTWL